VIRDLVTAYPFARTIHLVMDNLNIHCRKSLTDHLGEREASYLWSRLKVHHIPKHGSWLNQAEIELSLLSRQLLGSPPNTRPGPAEIGDPGLEPTGQPAQAKDPLDFYPQGRARQVWPCSESFQTVVDLVRETLSAPM